MTQYKEYTAEDSLGFSYKGVNNDQYGVRIYTLKNGLKVYLARNTETPRIQTYIAVRTGSNRDPKDNTGLAHYLEHMMFKGTSKIGAIDWEKEKVYLDQISDLYEKHKETVDAEEKKKIYREIDRLSGEASHLAIAGEYDKLLSSLGASGTNAHTWLDETVYKNNIPSNELQRWLEVEKERFSELTLRLFHTELETVYEEFNRAQDMDQRAVNEMVMSLLFPEHPNGQQTTIGKPEHLKNPSMKAIHAYFDQYYVPNNYAMVLVGDLEFESTIQSIDRTFGKLPFRELPKESRVEELPLTERKSAQVLSPSAPRLHLAWRTQSNSTRAFYLADLISSLLSNQGEVGILDLDINSKQKALYAGSYCLGFKDYGLISLVIVPKEQQSLEEAKELLMNSLEKIKKGDFADWMLSAILNDYKFQRLKSLESSDGLATLLYQCYIRGQSWKDELMEVAEYESITKEEIVAFANEFFLDNYVEVKKLQGENPSLVRVENPGISPIQLNQEEKSTFFQYISSIETLPIEPQFVDFDKEISPFEVRGRKGFHVTNKLNNRCQLTFIFPFGRDHDKKYEIAISLLSYLGSEKRSNEEIKLEFYKLGVNFDFQVVSDEIRISLVGLEENLGKGIDLLLEWVLEVKDSDEVYQEFVSTILESRQVSKTDKNKINKALVQYAQFGRESRFRDVFSTEQLKGFGSHDFTKILKELVFYPFEIFYYGQDGDTCKEVLQNLIPQATKPIPQKNYYPKPKGSNTYYFTPYDMVQVELTKIGRSSEVNPKNFGLVNVFNEYFGSGLSSIVFQQIRESQSLAYSAYAYYHNATKAGEWDYVSTFLGTQPDKLSAALTSMNTLMEDLPYHPVQFESAKTQVLKRIASGRIIKTNLFFNLHTLKKLGINYDIREEIYKQVQTLDFSDLQSFYKERIQQVRYNMALIGKESEIKRNLLEKEGELITLSLEEIFNY